MTNFVRQDGFSIKRSGDVKADCDTLKSALQTRDQNFEAGLKMLFAKPAGAEPTPEAALAPAPAQRNNAMGRKQDAESVRTRLRMSLRSPRR
jgi:hypothetical protein